MRGLEDGKSRSQIFQFFRLQIIALIYSSHLQVGSNTNGKHFSLLFITIFTTIWSCSLNRTVLVRLGSFEFLIPNNLNQIRTHMKMDCVFEHCSKPIWIRTLFGSCSFEIISIELFQIFSSVGIIEWQLIRYLFYLSHWISFIALVFNKRHGLIASKANINCWY